MDNDKLIPNPTPEQQAALMASVGNTITPDLLKKRPEAELPSSQPSSSAPIPSITDTLMASLDSKPTEAQLAEQSIRNQYLEAIFNQPTNQAQFLKQQQEAQRLPQLRTELQAINSRQLQLAAEIQADDVQLAQKLRATEQRDTLRPFALGEQSRIAGDAAIYRGLKNAEIASLNAQALAKQGEIALARDFAQQATDAEFEPYKAQLEQYKAVLDALAPVVSRDDAKQLQIQNRKYEIAKAEVEAAKQEKQGITDIALTVAQNGGDPSAIFGAKTLDEAISLAGSNLATANTSTIKLDNGNTLLINSRTGEIIKNFGGAKPATTTSGALGDAFVKQTFGSIINLTKNLEGTVAGKEAVQQELSNMLARQDYTSAYNQIANTVAKSLTGEVKTRFENAQVDIEVLGGLRDAINEFAAAGGDTGLLTGKAEEISRKLLGVTGDPELTALAVQLQREFQSYRSAMTGAAFTDKESRDYASVNPTSGKKLDLNLAVIDGAMAQLENRFYGTIEAKVKGASQIRELAAIPQKTAQITQTLDDVYLSAGPETRDYIDALEVNGVPDEQVLEYLQNRGLIPS